MQKYKHVKTEKKLNVCSEFCLNLFTMKKTLQKTLSWEIYTVFFQLSDFTIAEMNTGQN